MNTHLVCRPFTADKPLKVGEEVDASRWPNAGPLESQGFIRPIVVRTGREEGRAPKPAKRGAKARKRS